MEIKIGDCPAISMKIFLSCKNLHEFCLRKTEKLQSKKLSFKSSPYIFQRTRPWLIRTAMHPCIAVKRQTYAPFHDFSNSSLPPHAHEGGRVYVRQGACARLGRLRNAPNTPLPRGQKNGDNAVVSMYKTASRFSCESREASYCILSVDRKSVV